MTSVVIADDQPLVRSGFRLILESFGIEVLGEAGDGVEAIDVAMATRPDVVLMDIRMPRMDGLEATARVCTIAKVLILTTFGDDEYVFKGLRAGASGFLLKDATRTELRDAVEVVARGDAILAPSVTRAVVSRFAGGLAGKTRSTDPGVATLTIREREVLDLVIQGLTNSEIAEALSVGEATVKTHVARVLMKLGVRDRVQAVIYAYENGLARSS